MPIYKYECKNCGDKFEAIHGINEKYEYPCMQCESTDIQRCLPKSFIKKEKNTEKENAKERVSKFIEQAKKDKKEISREELK